MYKLNVSTTIVGKESGLYLIYHDLPSDGGCSAAVVVIVEGE